MSVLDDFKDQAKKVPMPVWIGLGIGTVVLAFLASKNKGSDMVAIPNLGNADTYGKVSESEIAARLAALQKSLTNQFKDEQDEVIGEIKNSYDESFNAYKEGFEDRVNALQSGWNEKEKSLNDQLKDLLAQLASRNNYSSGGSGISYSPPPAYHDSSPQYDFSYKESTGNKYNDIVQNKQTEFDRVMGGYYDNKENRQFLLGDELRRYEYAKATGDYSAYKPGGVESWN